MRVWDPLLRLLHWSLVATVVASWLTRHSPGRLHEWVGYGAMAVVAIRFAWGFAGPYYARFSQFVRPPGQALAYLRDARQGRATRHLGHNPAGGWMTVVLLLFVAAISITGWMYTTDRFWGIAWVGETHLWLTNALMLLVALHLAGVAWSSWVHRENLVAAMLHGKKKVAGS
ncbi:cytochrome B [Marinihelvus fidelis]|uniref:Cytochrome B n=1 Tax=Marinihelvus fidelis TaxID=2613842 RepID=A0A5N0TGD7_9GAMM|nr:cytochrome B [Marinihelvus fidelis]